MAADGLNLGDSYFVDEDYISASEAYSSALSSLDATEGATDGEPQPARLVRFRALSHRSAARLHLRRLREALDDAGTALALLGGGGLEPSALRDGEEESCRWRAGRAAFELGSYGEAKSEFEMAAGLARAAGRDATRHEAWAGRCGERTAQEDGGGSGGSPPPVAIAAAATPVAAPTAASPPRSVPASPAKRPAMPKYQYYQSDAVMTIAVLEPNVKPEDLRVDIGLDTLTVVLTKQGVDFTVICGTLYDAVLVDRCKIVHKDEKVLIKLRKKDRHEWQDLFGSGAPKEEKEKEEKEEEEKKVATKKEEAADAGVGEEKPAGATAVPTIDPAKPRAYVSHRDWDAIERDLKRQEEEEKPEGDEALNKLFRDIYGKADEDTRRAMIKSFQTSGGTVLSTNWSEVAKTDYEKERQAPKGMEWKDREGNRLPQKDD